MKISVLRIFAIMTCLLALPAGARNLSFDLTAPVAPKRMAAAAAVQESGTIRSHRLAAGAAQASGLAVGDVIAFRLFADQELTVTLVEETPALTGRSFLGRIDNAIGALGCVVLETAHGIILDVTDFEHGRVWQVVSDASGVTVREVKPLQNGRCGGDTLHAPSVSIPVNVSVTITNGVTTVVTNDVAVRGTAAMPLPSNVVSSAVASVPKRARLAAAATAGGNTTVDILINYDTDAAAWAKAHGGGLTTFAETAVQKMNTAIANTGLDQYFRFRLVGIYEVGGSAGGDLDYAVDFASGKYAGSKLNGVCWDGVRAERNRVSADIVCTLCYYDTSRYSSVTTGLGYPLKSTSSDVAGCGFNACLIQYVASDHTMTHEVGHNMGAGHSDAMADKSNCGPQYYSYSSGYYFYVGSTGYYTIMGYNADGYGNYYTEVPYFSSPNHTYKGVAVGNATHDNTQTLRRNYAMVADNRKPPFVSAEIGQGLDAESYTWMTDGIRPWVRVTDRSSDGVDSACSCLTPTMDTSWMETKVKGPATLSFKHWLTSYGGQFLVTCDGQQIYSRGSSTTASQAWSWTSATGLSIPSGVHTVRFSHVNSNTSYYSPANAVWIDQLVFAGGSPVAEEGEATSSTEVPVPFDWLATYYPKAATSDYETIAAQKGANGRTVWESYVAGLDPTEPTSEFKAVVTFENGVPKVEYEPKLSVAQTALRTYTTYGKKTLSNGWIKVTPGTEANYNFFKVTVEMK